MGAFESSGFADTDDDGLPDWWELKYFGSKTSDEGPDDDYDGDGLSNLEELKAGSNPEVPVNIVITEPSNSPYFTNEASLLIKMSTINAESVVVSTGSSVTNNGDGTWSSNIALASGNHVILVTAEGPVNGTDYEATDSLTVVRDGAAPTLTITGPTSGGSYSTALASITVSGFAGDDTSLDEVSWSNDGATGIAAGTTSWSTGPIELDDGVNTITITAVDIFGNASAKNIVITKQAAEAIENVAQDISEDQPIYVMDDLDTDDDGFANEDEIACGSDPNTPNLIVNPGATPAIPDLLYSELSIYTEGEKIGKYKPDCLNRDIDDDGLPNWWEEQYYSGSSTAGLAGGDEDEDACNNTCEYERGTDPTVPQTIAFSLEVLEIVDDQGQMHDPSTWLPEFGHTLKIRATWSSVTGSAPAEAVFSLSQTSSHPGRAVNDPDPTEMGGNDGYPDWYYNESPSIDQYHGPDFGLTEIPLNTLADCGSVNCFNQGIVSVQPESSSGNTYIIYLHSWDFGGRANLMVTDDQSGNNIGQMWIPDGSNKNGIGSAWDIGKDLDDDGEYDVGVMPGTLDPNADIDFITFNNSGSYTAPLGDDFSNFEEYRGIVYTPTMGGSLTHIRMDPFRKDLFIRAHGFEDAPGDPYREVVQAGSYSFRLGRAFLRAGIDVHNTTSWGHDATEDGSFYVYYHQGTIDSIDDGDKIITGTGTAWSATWPKHEWEFKLDNSPEDTWAPIGYWGITGDELGLDFAYGADGSGSYKIRKPVPHINILIVRNDQGGTYGLQDGHIQFISASPPSQQNPLGTRYWRWSTKGYAWCQTTSNQESMYGLAVALETPLDNYFSDKPYLDGSTWDDSEVPADWVSADGRLNPLSVVEDRTDQLNPIDGIMGDTPDGIWDGDKRLTDLGGNLNPFDIDSDGRVELPVASDLINIVNEYDLDQVLMHTITHEIGHALAGPTHTNDPACLMYKYSNNWSRADYLSDIYRSLLRVHNITR